MINREMLGNTDSGCNKMTSAGAISLGGNPILSAIYAFHDRACGVIQ